MTVTSCRGMGITYPGTNNFTDFTFDAYGRCVKILETTNGSVTSTKQFVWCGFDRCEERDGSGSLNKQFFGSGQKNGSSIYLYSADHLGSVREMTDSSGAIQAQYAYSPFGERTVISETVASDFSYTGHYLHSRSGLNLAVYRAYNASLGRWLSRDPAGETAGANLYQYANNPISSVDPLGDFVVATYKIREGVFVAVESTTGHVIVVLTGIFSGNNVGPLAARNNSAFAGVPFSGPIPTGTYFIRPEAAMPAHPSIMAFGLTDVNDDGSHLHRWTHRSGMMIHPGTLSYGCVTFQGYDNPNFRSLETMLNETEGFGRLRAPNIEEKALQQYLNLQRMFGFGGASTLHQNYDWYKGILKVLP